MLLGLWGEGTCRGFIPWEKEFQDHFSINEFRENEQGRKIAPEVTDGLTDNVSDADQILREPRCSPRLGRRELVSPYLQ